ncbi:MAG: protein translocase subunit SecF [Chloroflexota bacterium]|nr:protein translocase subunit SecF [Chloroflexota bacterium]
MDFVGKRRWYFIFSALVIIPGIISLLIPPGLKPGIEFTGGTAMTIRFEKPVERTELQQEVASLLRGDVMVQRTGEGDFFIRTKVLEGEQKDPQGNTVKPSQRQELEQALGQKFGPFTVREFDSISPIVAGETVFNAGLVVVLAAIGMLVYIIVAFRHLPKPFRYGVCAVAALVHEVLVVLGIFSLMGRFLGTEVDLMFIAALLTVIGYSINDAIVVFDRIRDNLGRARGYSFEVTVNNSIMETLSRSLSTGLCTLFVLLAIYLFGGASTRDFALALFIGIVSGTYSTIFNAAQLLVVWENGDVGRFFQRRILRRPAEG